MLILCAAISAITRRRGAIGVAARGYDGPPTIAPRRASGCVLLRSGAPGRSCVVLAYLQLLPRVHRDLGVWRQRGDINRGLHGMPWHVIREVVRTLELGFLDPRHQGQGAVAFVLMITHHGRAVPLYLRLRDPRSERQRGDGATPIGRGRFPYRLGQRERGHPTTAACRRETALSQLQRRHLVPCARPETGSAFVRHQANAPSGGRSRPI